MNPESYEQIELYFLGKLTGEELQAFERRLATEPDFSSEVALHRSVFEAVRMQKTAGDFRKQLSRVIAKVESEQRQPIGRRRRLAMAAGLLLLATLGWFFYQKMINRQPQSPQALFDRHFVAPVNISVPQARRGKKESTTGKPDSLLHEVEKWNALWTEMETQYARKNFAAALAAVQQIQALDPKNEYASETYFYSGLLHLRLNQPGETLKDFEKVTVGHSEDKAWYGALALLALGKNAEAKAALENIARSNSLRKAEAMGLSKELLK